MDENDLKPISFRASAEEVEAIDRAARENGLSRAEYIRQRVTNPAEAQSSGVTGGGQPSKDTTVLLRHILYGLQRINCAIYRIAEKSGTLGPDQLQEIADRSTERGLQLLANLDEHIAKTRSDLVTRLANRQAATAGK